MSTLLLPLGFYNISLAPAGTACPTGKLQGVNWVNTRETLAAYSGSTDLHRPLSRFPSGRCLPTLW